MSAYIAPVLNNGVLNTTFNSSDFEGTYPDSFLPLSGGNITGGLNVSENLGVSGAIDANDLTVSGNVGIGTTSPDADLHIYGGSNNTELFLGEDAAVDKCGILKYIQGNGNGTGSLQVGNWGDNFSYQAFCINKGGNVGVGFEK